MWQPGLSSHKVFHQLNKVDKLRPISSMPPNTCTFCSISFTDQDTAHTLIDGTDRLLDANKTPSSFSRFFLAILSSKAIIFGLFAGSNSPTSSIEKWWSLFSSLVLELNAFTLSWQTLSPAFLFHLKVVISFRLQIQSVTKLRWTNQTLSQDFSRIICRLYFLRLPNAIE